MSLPTEPALCCCAAPDALAWALGLEIKDRIPLLVYVIC